MEPLTNIISSLRRSLIAAAACLAVASAVTPAESNAQTTVAGGTWPLVTTAADLSYQRFGVAPTRYDALLYAYLPTPRP